MKSIYKHFSCNIVLLMLIIPAGTYANSNINKAPEIDPVKFHQIKAQVYLFKQVLDEFGATSSSQAVELWAKSERNGVYQYAVSCDELKQKIIEKWGKAEENFWIIGGSSPSTYKYEIVENEKINENTYKVKLKFYWASSLGEEPTYKILTIIKEEKYWCVNDYK